MKKGIWSFVQFHIRNSVVVAVIGLLSFRIPFLRRIFGKRGREKRLQDNSKQMLLHQDESPKLVENQRDYGDVRYGNSTMSYSGCEIFAVYNAMLALQRYGKNPPSLAGMISEFELKGMVLHGLWGTAPKALATYLESKGYQVEMIVEEEKFDALGEKSKALVLTMFNDRYDIRKQVHTVCITKREGLYSAHNVYGNGTVTPPYKSISELIAHLGNGNAKGIALIGIN